MYQLVQNPISHDTIEALETLLAGAKSGEITGIAFACTMKKTRYFTDVAGACYKNPTFSRGMLMTLGDELSAMIHERDTLDTR